MSASGRNLPHHPTSPLGAYDTPPELCRAIYRKALDLGLLSRDTPILEPHVGSGNMLAALNTEAHRGPVEIMDVDPTAPGLELGRTLAAQGRPVIVDAAPEDPGARAWATAQVEADKIPTHRHPLVVDGFLVRRPVLSGPELVILGNPPYSVTPAPETCPRCNGAGRVVKRGAVSRDPGQPPPPVRCPGCSDKLAERGTGLVKPPPIGVADYHVHRGLQVARRVIYVLRGPFREGQARYRSLYASGTLAEAWTSPRRASFAWGGTDSTETAVFTWDLDLRPDPVDGPGYVGRWIEW